MFTWLDIYVSCHFLTLINACHFFIPTVTIPSTPSPKWFNAEIRHYLNKINTIRCLVRKNPTTLQKTKWCSLESSLQKLKRSPTYLVLSDIKKTSTSNMYVSNEAEITRAWLIQQLLPFYIYQEWICFTKYWWATYTLLTIKFNMEWTGKLKSWQSFEVR